MLQLLPLLLLLTRQAPILSAPSPRLPPLLHSTRTCLFQGVRYRIHHAPRRSCDLYGICYCQPLSHLPTTVPSTTAVHVTSEGGETATTSVGSTAPDHVTSHVTTTTTTTASQVVTSLFEPWVPDPACACWCTVEEGVVFRGESVGEEEVRACQVDETECRCGEGAIRAIYREHPSLL